MIERHTASKWVPSARGDRRKGPTSRMTSPSTGSARVRWAIARRAPRGMVGGVGNGNTEKRSHRKAMGANRLVWHPSHNFSTRPACSQQNDEIGVRHRSDQIDSVRRTVHRTARWSALAVATAAFMTTACRDSKVDVAAADSSLARDITLASAVTAPRP